MDKATSWSSLTSQPFIFVSGHKPTVSLSAVPFSGSLKAHGTTSWLHEDGSLSHSSLQSHKIKLKLKKHTPLRRKYAFLFVFQGQIESIRTRVPSSKTSGDGSARIHPGGAQVTKGRILRVHVWGGCLVLRTHCQWKRKLRRSKWLEKDPG